MRHYALPFPSHSKALRGYSQRALADSCGRLPELWGGSVKALKASQSCSATYVSLQSLRKLTQGSVSLHSRFRSLLGVHVKFTKRLCKAYKFQ